MKGLVILRLIARFLIADGPTIVELGIYINGFYEISEQTMVSLFFLDN